MIRRSVSITYIGSPDFLFLKRMQISKELIARCRKHERAAQFELYRDCYGILMAVCLRYEKNKEDAEELLNLAFYKILTRLDKYNDDTPFEAWIRRITINTVIDEFRKKNRDRHAFFDQLEGHVPVSSMDFNEADRQFDAEELEIMIRELPPVSQKVFNLYVIDGYNHKEIGEMLGISEGTSKWHLSTARKTLKKKLKGFVSKVASIML